MREHAAVPNLRGVKRACKHVVQEQCCPPQTCACAVYAVVGGQVVLSIQHACGYLMTADQIVATFPTAWGAWSHCADNVHRSGVALS